MESKKETAHLKTPYEIIKVTSTADLLNAKPIVSHKDYTTARNEIGASVVKCSDSLGVELTDMAIGLITSDLIDKYKHESIEDILICLKKGRSGYYGNNYGKLNLIVISEWMEKHLGEKATTREKELSRFKEKIKEPIDGVDYDAYKARVNKEQKQKEKMSRQINPESLETYMKYLTEMLPHMTKDQVEQIRKNAETLGRHEIVRICNAKLNEADEND